MKRISYARVETCVSLSLSQIELKQVRWKGNHESAVLLADDFLPIESCRLGPLTIVDRWYVERSGGND